MEEGEVSEVNDRLLSNDVNLTTRLNVYTGELGALVEDSVDEWNGRPGFVACSTEKLNEYSSSTPLTGSIKNLLSTFLIRSPGSWRSIRKRNVQYSYAIL